MRGVIKILVTIIVVFTGFVAALIVMSELDHQTLSGYATSDAEPKRVDWPGTPIDQYGRFINHQFPYLPTLRGLLTWQLSPNQFRDEKRADTIRPSVEDPKPFLDSDVDGLIWLGHASFYIRSKGVGILIDPVFDEPTFIRRQVAVESQLPHIRNVDLVLLSHDHRDHLDEPSIRAIVDRFPNAKFLAGNGSVDLLSDWVGDRSRIVTANWFEQFPLSDDRIAVHFVPVRHWSRRGLFDLNRRLWGGFVIQTSGFSLYHGGDSGYGDHYRLVADTFPQIDYFLIGIGAYEPRWFMEPNHNDPSDVTKAFRDIDAKFLVPMHYGTFEQSDEPSSWPLRDLKIELERNAMIDRLLELPINGVIQSD